MDRSLPIAMAGGFFPRHPARQAQGANGPRRCPPNASFVRANDHPQPIRRGSAIFGPKEGLRLLKDVNDRDEKYRNAVKFYEMAPL